MKSLEEIMLIGQTGICKEANQGLKALNTFVKHVYPYAALAAGATAISKEIAAPLGEKIMSSADHNAVLKRIKSNYPKEKHGMLSEVYGVLTHTAPHMARNYLIAKTLVDQKMSVMEQLSGSHPAGVQIPLPTLEQAIGMEKGVASATKSSKGSLEGIAGNMFMGQVKTGEEKVASLPVEPVEDTFETFLKELL